MKSKLVTLTNTLKMLWSKCLDSVLYNIMFSCVWMLIMGQRPVLKLSSCYVVQLVDLFIININLISSYQVCFGLIVVTLFRKILRTTTKATFTAAIIQFARLCSRRKESNYGTSMYRWSTQWSLKLWECWRQLWYLPCWHILCDLGLRWLSRWSRKAK